MWPWSVPCHTLFYQTSVLLGEAEIVPNSLRILSAFTTLALFSWELNLSFREK